jgi:hypothetical protein
MHKFTPDFHYLVILSRSVAEAKNPVFAFQERDSSAFGLRMTNAILGMNLRIGILRNINQRRYPGNAFLHKLAIFDRDLNGFLRADTDTMTTAPAGVTDDSTMVHQVDGVHKTYILSTSSTTHTPVTHCDGKARHPCDLGADPGCNVGQHPPKTAARTAVADGQKSVPRTDAEPHRIQLVASNQMNQASFTAASHVLERFLSRHAASELGVDPQGRLPKKETAQINGIILTLLGFATDTRVHNPVGIGFFDEMFHHLRG